MNFNWQQRKSDLLVCIDFLVVAVLLVFAIWWAYNDFMTSPPYVDDEIYPVRGIDVSAHNGVIDFKDVASDGYQFVFIKASEGESFRDSTFAVNYRNAVGAGLKVGAYHFFRFDRDGVAQAINLLGAVEGKKLDLGVVIDVETHGNPEGVDPNTIADRINGMVDYLNLLGFRVTFYTNRDGYYDYIASNFPTYPLWICSFNSHPINAEWTFWQFNHHGKVKGIKGDVDINAFNGNIEEWNNTIKESKER